MSLAEVVQHITVGTTKKFNLKEWGMMYSFGPAWPKFNCPNCNKFNADSFLFTFELNKTSYESFCKKCNSKLTIRISLDLNNKIYRIYERRTQKIEDSCLRRQYAKKKHKYLIEIEAPDKEAYPQQKDFCSLDCEKLFGNCHGFSGGMDTKEEAISMIKQMVQAWINDLQYEKGQKPTTKNTFIYTEVKELSITEIKQAINGDSTLADAVLATM